MLAQSKNCETSRDSRYYGTVGNSRVIAEKVAHATIEELLEAVFSVRSVPRLYKESALSLVSSQRLVSAVRKLQGREEQPLLEDCKRATSSGGCSKLR
jgi:hypothetical protein